MAIEYCSICGECGKRNYETRRKANAAKRFLKQRTGESRTVYPACQQGYYHVGRLPRDVIKGRANRHVVYGRAS